MTAPRAIPKPRIREHDFTEQVIDLARRCGWKVAHFHAAQTPGGRWITPVKADGKGWVDLFMCRGRRALAAELKVGYNKPSAEQEAWLAALSLADIPAEVWTPDMWDHIQEVLR